MPESSGYEISDVPPEVLRDRTASSVRQHKRVLVKVLCLLVLPLVVIVLRRLNGGAADGSGTTTITGEHQVGVPFTAPDATATTTTTGVHFPPMTASIPGVTVAPGR